MKIYFSDSDTFVNMYTIFLSFPCSLLLSTLSTNNYKLWTKLLDCTLIYLGN